MFLQHRYESLFAEFQPPNVHNYTPQLLESQYTILDKTIPVQSNSPFTISCWNANGLNTYQKFTSLQTLMNLTNTTVQFVVETHLKDSTTHLYTLQHYNSQYQCRQRATKKGSGGLLVFIKDKVEHTRYYLPETLQTDEKVVEVLCIQLKNPKMLLLGLYRPPNGSVSRFLDWLTRMLHHFSSLRIPVMLVGDFNINILANTSEATRLIRLCMSFSLKPAITLPTRAASDSLLDHMWVPASQHINARIPIYDSSDHYPVVVDCTEWPTAHLRQRPLYVLRRRLTDTHINNFQTALQTTDWNFIERSEDVDEMWRSFTIFLSGLFEQHCPLYYQKVSPPAITPWLSPFLKRQSAIKNRLFRALRRTPSNVLLLNAYRLQRKKVSRLIKAAKLSFVTRQLARAASPKDNWRIYFKLIGRSQVSPGPASWTGALRDRHGKIISDNQSMAELFNNHFASIGTQVSASVGIPCDLPSILTDEVSSPFTLKKVNDLEITLTGRTLRSSFKGARYGMPTSILKTVLPALVEPLLVCMNASIQKSIFPKVLKHAIITPIYKKGNAETPSNWRPISALPVLAKLFEKILFDRLQAFAQRSGFLSKAQFGFQPGVGTQQALLRYLADITSTLDNAQGCLLVSLDVEKAYDTIQTKFLLHKLRHYGIRGSALELFASFLSDRTHTTCWKGRLSTEISPRCGLPQGSILSPLLFLIYINDLFSINIPGSIIAYADDTAVLFPITSHSPENENYMISLSLAHLHAWYSSNALKLNQDKTAAVLLRNKNASQTIPKDLSFNGVPLETYEVASLKILGIIFDPHLTWREQFEKIASRLSLLNALLFKLRMEDFPLAARLRCYKVLFLPVLTYGVAIWGFAARRLRTIVQRLQKTALRHIKALPPRTSVKALFKTLKLLTFTQIRDLQVDSWIHKERCSTLPRFPEFTPIATRTTSRITDQHMLTVPHTRTSLRANTPFSQGIKHYNTLPIELRQLNRYRIFKKRIRIYYETTATTTNEN